MKKLDIYYEVDDPGYDDESPKPWWKKLLDQILEDSEWRG